MDNHYIVTYESDVGTVLVAFSNDINDTVTNNYITALHAAKRVARENGTTCTITCEHKLSNGHYFTTTRTITPTT